MPNYTSFCFNHLCMCLLCYCRPHVSAGEADGAECGGGSGQYTGDPEHAGVLFGPREQ